jgi:hypothetical protein
MSDLSTRNEGVAATSIPPKAYVIDPEQRTITPVEPSSAVCQALSASIETLRPPYLGTIDFDNGVFLSDGAYCVEDPYGAWEPSRPWFEMDFQGPDGGVAEHRWLVGPCLVLGFGHGQSHRYVLRDATIAVEELAERVRFQPTPPPQTTTR